VYTYKIWIARGREYFEYGNEQKKKKHLPFGKSLMDFLYLDIWSYNSLFEDMIDSFMELCSSKEQRYADEVLAALNMIASTHIYFELFRLEWQNRLEKAKCRNYENVIELLPYKEFRLIPSNVSTMQEQIKMLFERVLDLDSSGKESVQKKMVDYYSAKGEGKLNTFRFEPQSMSFEVIDRNTFTEVLYPKNIYLIIDYFMREYVKQEQPVRICKNCKRYFAISGRISSEYCYRPIDDKGRTCKDMGAINLWNKKRQDDEIFKVYRREYKKRFGWIKSGKIEQDAFYVWSENAREQKARCDKGEISLQEFIEWLKSS
jgi:hypothetical protein